MRETTNNQTVRSTNAGSVSRKRDAVRPKSGKSVAHSDPGLMEPSIPGTADRNSAARVKEQGAMLRPASHQLKNGREFEGGALISVAGAVSPSLDSIQINRDRPEGLKHHCSRWTVRGRSVAEPMKTRFCSVGCKCWGCSRCGPRKANRYRARVRQLAEQHGLNILLTLTLDPKKLRGRESTHYINETFADFRVYLRRRLGFAPPYIRVLEYQKNGTAHLHVLLNRFIPQAWVSDAWQSLGGGRIVDVRRVDMHRVSHYLSKYLTKEMLLYAPRRARRVTCSKGIRMREDKPKTHIWQVVMVNIARIFDLHVASAINIQAPEGHLLAFETLSDCFG